MSKILEALNKLDPQNDNHWTADGQPRLDTLKMFAGEQALTRDAVAEAAPGFCRAALSTWNQQKASAAPAAPAPKPAPSMPATKTNAPAAPTQVPGPVNTAPAVTAPAAQTAVPAMDEATLLKLQSAKVEALRQQIAELTKQMNKEQSQENRLIDAAERSAKKKTDAEEYQEYLKAQARRYEERAVRKGILKEINYAQLKKDLASPLDSAYASRRRKGY